MVLRDLSEMYNWDMKNKIFCWVIDVGINKNGFISKKPLDIYINIGHYLVDVKKFKKEKVYEKLVENKNVYTLTPWVGQDLLNDVSYGKIGYLPVKFGLIGPYENDKKYDKFPFNTDYSYCENVKNKEKYSFLPKNKEEMNFSSF